MSEEKIQILDRSNGLKRFARVFFSRWLVIFGLTIVLGIIILAVFAPLIATHDPYKTALGQGLQGPNSEHLLGTDVLGRDTFSRIVFGARVSLMIGVVVIVIAALIGMGLGLIAGYFGRWVYIIIMRFTDALMSFPFILIALIIAALLGGGLRNVIIALTVGLIPTYIRLMCAEILTIKENEYILAERSLGSGHWRIMFRHLVPNSLPPLIVLMTMMLGQTILAEAGLSFLGIGVKAPEAAWGSMVADGRIYLLKAPILSFAPGLMIMLLTFSFNMVGDGLRDALDPRLRGIL